MREVNRLLDNVVIPKMVRVQQTFEHEHIAREMIGSVISDILSEEKLESQIQPGMRIALPAGSREICNMDEILASVVQALKKRRTPVYCSGYGKSWRRKGRGPNRTAVTLWDHRRSHGVSRVLIHGCGIPGENRKGSSCLF